MARKYDAADFIVPPQTQNGHSERVQCRIQAAHLRALNIIARADVFPYQQKEDVIRWCIKHGLNMLADLEPALCKSVMSQANMIDRIATDHLYRQKFLEAFNKLHESVSYYLANQMPGEALIEIRDARKQLEAMPANGSDLERRWRSRYMKEFEKYAYLETDSILTGSNGAGHVIPMPPPPPSAMAWTDDSFAKEGEDDTNDD